MNKKVIGVIGRGFVGSAVAHGFSHSVGYDAEILIYDKDQSKSSNTLEEIVQYAGVVFISVPTPSNEDGSINLDILDACLRDINETASKLNIYDSVYLVRSTVVPGTTSKFQEKFPKLKLVFNPEFLTERSALFDFISQTRIVLGGKKEYTKTVKDLYQDRFGKSLTVIETNYESAEMIKYLCNTFFATKVSFLNEMKLLSDAVGASWDDVIEGFLRDGRVGNSHSQVPGPDGKLGFGGSCFPKDIQALINFGDTLSIDLAVLKGAWKTNLFVRPEKDWEKLIGRAISEKKDN
jgi:nucleotide sugar dehydrogenase|tara:strand:- start:896 stop:1774 length:879 start_codon:yes stop_codon:yes gene_type:complete